jgi:hypothetical protein
MKKQILNLGKALNKAEQKSINGGLIRCNDQSEPNDPYTTCPPGYFCSVIIGSIDSGHCILDFPG